MSNLVVKEQFDETRTSILKQIIDTPGADLGPYMKIRDLLDEHRDKIKDREFAIEPVGQRPQ